VTPEAQLVALAEAHGYKWYHRKGHPDAIILAHPEDSYLAGVKGSWVETTKPTHENYHTHGIRPYLTDLQAMHELIMTRIVFGPPLHQYQSNEAAFQLALDEISMREQVPVWHFDASLYAEALLKTLKTWSDK